MKTLGFLVLAALPVFVSCGGSGPASPTRTDLATLSGVWAGTVTVTQVGGCSFSGGPSAVTMDWTVTDAGQLTISERQSQATWSGTITSDLRVSANKTATAICNGSPNTYTGAYTGTIRRDGSDRVDLEAVATPCPPTCTFRFVYSVVRQ